MLKISCCGLITETINQIFLVSLHCYLFVILYFSAISIQEHVDAEIMAAEEAGTQTLVRTT